MLACPRCNVSLKSHTITTDVDGWEVEVDACQDSCGGLWLEAHDFDADPKAKLLLDQELLSLNVPRKKNINTQAPADCPACRIAMHRFDWNNEGIHVDTCPMCKGRWLDGGEMQRVQATWNQEPVDPLALMGKLKTIEKETADRMDQQTDTFLEWCMKRLLLTSSRSKKD
jgi:Zn-finger nucleic acid-binding protein